MIDRLLSRMLHLDPTTVIESWSLRLGAGLPFWLLVVGLVAGLIGAILLYRREALLGRVGRLAMALARTVAVAALLLMIFRPMARVALRQETKPTVLVLVDESTSMDIRDTRKDLPALAEAGLALGKLPPDDPQLSRAVLRAWRTMESRSLALESGTPLTPAIDKDVTAALAAVRTAAQKRSPTVGQTLLAALDDLAARQKAIGENRAADADPAKLCSEQRSLAAELSQWKEKALNSGLTVADSLAPELSQISRRELVQQTLRGPARPVLEELTRRADVRFFRFGGTVEESPFPWTGTANRLAATPRIAATNATHLGSALTDVLERSERLPVTAIALITDGANNGGIDPLAAARQLRQRGLPLVTVGVGLPQPDDAILRTLVVPDVVFANDLVTVRVQCRASGYERRTTPLVVRLDGNEVARETVTFTGQPQIEEVRFRAPRTRGTPALEVELTPLPGEATLANNTQTQTLRVLDDKIKVLYIEGSPRWEFRYLRAVLKRDPRIDVRFITTEGDKDLARASAEHLGRFPETAEEALQYDLIILGDVRANIFTPTQFGFMEQLVRERGGSLIMLAGHKHTPGEYLDTPIAAMLPVRFDQEPWGEIGDDVYPALTAAGRQSSVMKLEPLESRNQALWANVKPMFRVPPVRAAKPGAVVLAELSDRTQRAQSFPLIAWQRYGTGKCLFVGVDQLWRMRARTGDKYHLRFWGQAVQFLTLSRLLGENKLVRLETSHDHYAVGATVELFANALDETYEPLTAASYQAYVTRVDSGESKPVLLKAVPNAAGLYTGLYAPPGPGRYRFSSQPLLSDAPPGQPMNGASDTDFVVVDSTAELIETGRQQGLLSQMAALTGGAALSLRELPLLADAVAERPLPPRRYTRDLELWDNWLLLGLFILVASAEWAWRRNKNLA